MNKYIRIGKAIQKAINEQRPIKNIKMYAGDRFGEDIYLDDEDVVELIRWAESEEDINERS